MTTEIELIQKETKKENFFHFLMFDTWESFFIGILILVLVVCGGLWGYKKYLEKENDVLDVKIIDLHMKRDLNLENEVMNLNGKIRDIGSILSQRFLLSKLFSLVEKLAVSKSYFDKFSVSVKDDGSGTVNLQARTENYSDAASLIKIFEEEKSFKSVSVSSIKSEDGIVVFSVDVGFNPVLIE